MMKLPEAASFTANGFLFSCRRLLGVNRFCCDGSFGDGKAVAREQPVRHFQQYYEGILVSI